jgi:hypothetical protein
MNPVACACGPGRVKFKSDTNCTNLIPNYSTGEAIHTPIAVTPQRGCTKVAAVQKQGTTPKSLSENCEGYCGKRFWMWARRRGRSTCPP